MPDHPSWHIRQRHSVLRGCGLGGSSDWINAEAERAKNFIPETTPKRSLNC
jgi:hypothetical protein